MSLKAKKILITGSNGFIGKNLLQKLLEIGCENIKTYNRENNVSDLEKLTENCDVIYHLAGENRPINDDDFDLVNFGLTRKLCDDLAKLSYQRRKKIHLVYISSAHYNSPTKYGVSKKKAENVIENLSEIGVKSTIFRLPGVFGKWAKPNYNSVVATFCYNVAHGLPIKINEPQRELRLVYIDDVIEALIDAASKPETSKLTLQDVPIEYQISLVELANKISQFPKIRSTSAVPPVGRGIDRALYSTYLSYIPCDQFKYEITSHHDKRGSFVEFLKTSDSGQFSFFSAEKGVTRGGHYHHTKNEKFLVIKGSARFRLRNLITNEKVELTVSDKLMEVVDMPPGWAHDITNIGDGILLVMLWANEVFDPAKPDTIHSKLEDI